ncbi:MAG: acyltransferase [Cyanobacteria bacterium P01_G01_bin.67]
MLLKTPQRKFLNSINYFRGIAIILIILGHCYELSQWRISSNVADFFYSSSLNGSVYFVFISGFLYHHIFFSKFNYKKFMLKKAKYVLLPYIFCSSIPILYLVFLGGGGQYLPEGLKEKSLLAVGWYFVTGRISYAYWYIPMAMLLFAISPLINKIIKSQKTLIVCWFLLPISLIIHRPVNNINPVHSLIYFLPVYLLGIWSSINHQEIINCLQNNKRKIILIVAAVSLGIIQVLLFQKSGNFHKEFWSITVPDINLVQKILLCFLFISILNAYESADLSGLKKIAETSFAVYFIHPFLVNALISLTSKLDWKFQGNILTLALATLIVTLISLAIAYGIKAVFKQKSRYLIGW